MPYGQAKKLIKIKQDRYLAKIENSKKNHTLDEDQVSDLL